MSDIETKPSPIGFGMKASPTKAYDKKKSTLKLRSNLAVYKGKGVGTESPSAVDIDYTIRNGVLNYGPRLH